MTGDVDTISQFMQYGGLLLILSVGQLLVATVLMAFYSLLAQSVELRGAPFAAWLGAGVWGACAAWWVPPRSPIKGKPF